MLITLDHTTTRSDDYYSTHKILVQETPLGTLSPKPRDRVHLPTYIVITTTVTITVCSCMSLLSVLRNQPWLGGK